MCWVMIDYMWYLRKVSWNRVPMIQVSSWSLHLRPHSFWSEDLLTALKKKHKNHVPLKSHRDIATYRESWDHSMSHRMRWAVGTGRGKILYLYTNSKRYPHPLSTDKTDNSDWMGSWTKLPAWKLPTYATCYKRKWLKCFKIWTSKMNYFLPMKYGWTQIRQSCLFYSWI